MQTLESVRKLFRVPVEEAARALGIGVTALKKFCRGVGIKRWPYR